jgi:MFS superfamily sulfate permease-like transporter
VRYVVGPFDGVWIETLVVDVTAGITVALTLIPQGIVEEYCY